MIKLTKLLKEIKGPRLKMNIKNKLNDQIYRLTANKFFDEIPLQGIFDMLEKEDIVAIDEDGTRWSGLLMGREGKAMINIGPKYRTEVEPGGETAKTVEQGETYTPFDNAMLVLTWYRMDTGRYEVVAYVS